MSNSLDETLRTWVEVFMHRSMRNFTLYAKEQGLSISQFGALFHIHRKGACGVSDIGDDLGVTSAAASQMLDRLVQQDLILRSEDPHDRRLKQLVLTEHGHQILHQGVQSRQGWLADLVSLMNPAEQQQVKDALQLLIDKAGQLEETASEPIPAGLEE